jgi:hypothetical protein
MMLGFAAALMLSVVAVASAVAAEAPDLLRNPAAEIPAKTVVTASGTNPELLGKGSTIKCASVETPEGSSTVKGEVIGTSEKEISIKLLFVKCEEPSTKAVCTTTGEASGHILTHLLIVKFVSKTNEKGELLGGAVVRGEKGGNTEVLAEFTCGEKAVTVSGCVPATLQIEGASGTAKEQTGTMLEGKSEKEAVVEEKVTCVEKAFGSNSQQVSTEKFSFNTSGTLLSILLKI